MTGIFPLLHLKFILKVFFDRLKLKAFAQFHSVPVVPIQAIVELFLVEIPLILQP